MPKPYMPLLFCLSLLLLAACDKPSPPRSQLILGKWRLTKLESALLRPGEMPVTAEQKVAAKRAIFLEGTTIEFKPNSSYIRTVSLFGTEGGIYGSYYLYNQGQKLALKDPLPQQLVEQVLFSIVSLTEDSLVLQDERGKVRYLRERMP